MRRRSREPAAHAELGLSLPQQQQARVGRLVAAVKIHREFLAANGWQVEGKRLSVFITAVARRRLHEAVRLDSDCLRKSRILRHCRHSKLTDGV